ncbi:TspO/MBR family protein [Roseiarcus sp.]|uniref:TspO/MBR family protein n=1 Tax=Roseiarcus sp. TaxID=1969460 RepID=UPI003F959557
MIGALAERWPVIVVALASVTVCAVAGGLMTEIGPWYEGMNFPRLRPPNWLFGPAWTVIFLLIAASGVVAWGAADAERRTLIAVLFAINGVLNILWSPLFFKLRRPDWALYELGPFWLSIVALVFVLFGIRPLAGWLILPYLVWVTFAGWLNWRVVVLNRPFATRSFGVASAAGKSSSNGRVSR